ncbi:MAG: hypothetical protein H0U49_12670 [Parachlamydiaceae bacterium]|nr:hypothetical protein [Parachlamydiaceae bacterium]
MNKEIEAETLEVVNRQLDAYNKRDYESFASCYCSDIISFDLNTSEQILEMSGSNFFKHYSNKLQENPKIHCKVIERITCGNLVIDKELISNFQGANHDEVVIYQVEEQLISKMWFKR